MRKLATTIAVVWLLTVALICAAAFSSTARAAEIPSTASGAYSTPNGRCDVVFSRFGPDHVNVDIACPGTLDVGLIPGFVFCSGTCSHSTAFAFAGACIGAPGVAYAFPVDGQNPASPWLAFDAFDGTRLYVRRGVTAAQLYTGGGVSETWTMGTPLASPAPYACGRQALRFRVFGR